MLECKAGRTQTRHLWICMQQFKKNKNKKRQFKTNCIYRECTNSGRDSQILMHINWVFLFFTNLFSVHAESSKTLTDRDELITAEQPTDNRSLNLSRQKSLPLSILDTMPQLRLKPVCSEAFICVNKISWWVSMIISHIHLTDKKSWLYLFIVCLLS